MHLLEVISISRQEQEGFALSNISFQQSHHQKIAIAGETGSGKSTLLKIIAGLTQPDSGTVLFEGIRVKGPNDKLLPGHTRIAYLSQHYELRNHYRIEELLDMASKLEPMHAAAIYELCRISHLLKRRTGQLSGGERQRIALAALLTASPALFVLDEPYSNLDLIHKSILKQVLEDAAAELGITFLLASHEPSDVLSWAEQILVLKNGNLVQSGTPEQVYRNPLSEYVAGLFGKYSMLPPVILAELTGTKDRGPFVRPEDVIINEDGNGIRGQVSSAAFLGNGYEIRIALQGYADLVTAFYKHPLANGQEVSITIANG